MTRNFGIVCMHNAARSILLETYLQSIYPEFTFYSGGIAAEDGKQIPKITTNFSHLLGLAPLKKFSENTKQIENKILSSDYIICADDLICTAVEKSHSHQNTISVSSFAEPLGIRLIDPVNCLTDEFSYQVGKFLLCGLSTFRHLVEAPHNNPIHALISKNKDFEEEAQKLYDSLTTNIAKPILINTNLKYADESSLRKLVPPEAILKIDYRELIYQDCDDFVDTAMISPSYEMAAWERFVASIEWRNWLKTLALKRPVILLCTPVDIIVGKKHGSFLEALPADEVIYRV